MWIKKIYNALNDPKFIKTACLALVLLEVLMIVLGNKASTMTHALIISGIICSAYMGLKAKIGGGYTSDQVVEMLEIMSLKNTTPGRHAREILDLYQNYKRILDVFDTITTVNVSSKSMAKQVEDKTKELFLPKLKIAYELICILDAGIGNRKDCVDKLEKIKTCYKKRLEMLNQIACQLSQSSNSNTYSKGKRRDDEAYLNNLLDNLKAINDDDDF